jgi:hypothetical protein
MSQKYFNPNAGSIDKWGVSLYVLYIINELAKAATSIIEVLLFAYQTNNRNAEH